YNAEINPGKMLVMRNQRRSGDLPSCRTGNIIGDAARGSHFTSPRSRGNTAASNANRRGKMTRNAFRITYLMAALLLLSSALYAQWTQTGNDAVLTATGNVGIASSLPAPVPLTIGKIAAYRNLNAGSGQRGAFP